jgi:hypothetical protein
MDSSLARDRERFPFRQADLKGFARWCSGLETVIGQVSPCSSSKIPPSEQSSPGTPELRPLDLKRTKALLKAAIHDAARVRKCVSADRFLFRYQTLRNICPTHLLLTPF